MWWFPHLLNPSQNSTYRNISSQQLLHFLRNNFYKISRLGTLDAIGRHLTCLRNLCLRSHEISTFQWEYTSSITITRKRKKMGGRKLELTRCRREEGEPPWDGCSENKESFRCDWTLPSVAIRRNEGQKNHLFLPLVPVLHSLFPLAPV